MASDDEMVDSTERDREAADILISLGRSILPEPGTERDREAADILISLGRPILLGPELRTTINQNLQNILCQLRLIAQFTKKRLSVSDVCHRRDRFLITTGHLQANLENNELHRPTIPVTVYANFDQPVYTVYSLLLKQEQNGGKCVLTHREEERSTHWRDICRELGLRSGDSVEFSIFGDSEYRQTNHLVFLMKKKLAI